ncbi:MAG: hypothetical protein AAFY71_10560 [Bacteroidota bacterium]
MFETAVIIQEFIAWYRKFVRQHKFQLPPLTPEQHALIQHEWEKRTQFVPNDTFIFGIPFYNPDENFMIAGTEKFFGNQEMGLAKFLEYVSPSVMGCYALMGQAVYELAARPEFRAHASKGQFSQRSEIILRHYVSEKEYMVTQLSEPILFDERENLLFHINTYRIGNEASMQDKERFLSRVIHGPLEEHSLFTKALVAQAGMILWEKFGIKERKVAMAYISSIRKDEKITSAQIASMTGSNPRAITAANEKILKIGNTYCPFQTFATAYKFLHFAYKVGFFPEDM